MNTRLLFAVTLLLAFTLALDAFGQDAPVQDKPADNEQAAKTKEEKKPVVLKVGDSAPVFGGKDDKKKDWKSATAKGKKILVVYFYPADMTPGCTKQACAYRDVMKTLKRKDVEVIGISGDKPENHKHFREQYQLNFTLLSDPEGKIAKAFGVKTGKGGLFKREIAGTEITFERGVTTNRWTFVIDKDWKIAHIDRQVNAAKDSEKVFKLIEKME